MTNIKKVELTLYFRESSDFGSDCLFKYKGGTEKDINNFLHDKLWLPNINTLNDPLEFGIDNLKLQMIHNGFYKETVKTLYVLSFTKTTNIFCANYYGNGFKGFCLIFKEADLLKYLSDNRFDVSRVKDVEYLDYDQFEKKTNFDEYSFVKTKEWEIENERRVLIRGSFGEGLNLTGCFPYAIIIGFRMKYDNKLQIFEYCKKHNPEILVYEQTKDLDSGSSTTGYKKISDKYDFE